MLFTVYDIRECLYDAKRTESFAKAIKSTIKKGDIVVDAGSGSGILGLLALKYGAGKVYAIESNPRQKKIIENNARLNGFGGKIKVLIGDATKVRLPEKVDVILCELIHTATFFEPQMQIIDHLKAYLKPHGNIIPERMYSNVQLVKAQEYFYGLKLSYESREAIDEVALSESKQFDEIWFKEDEPLHLRTIVELKATKNGRVNALKFAGRLLLGGRVYLGETPHILMPEIVFLKEPFSVIRGKSYYIEIVYEGGADPLNVTIRRIGKISPAILKKSNYLAHPLT